MHDTDESHSCVDWAGLRLAWAWLAGLKKASACGVVVPDTNFWEWSGLVDRLFSFAWDGRVSTSAVFKGS